MRNAVILVDQIETDVAAGHTRRAATVDATVAARAACRADRSPRSSP